MSGVVGVAVVCLGLVALVGALVVMRTQPGPGRGVVAALGRRLGASADASVTQLGRVWTAAFVLLAGFGFAILSMWPLGELAHALEDAVDWPVFNWFEARQDDGWWHSLWLTLTQLGNRPETQLLTVVFAVALAGWWALTRRRWWVPLLVLPVGYLFEKYGQMVIKVVVDRGHPPTTDGTWISGGCARLTVVYGLVFFLACYGRRLSRRTWAIGWSALAFLMMVEAYSRTYLLKHWVTDVVGGLAYGLVVLLTMMAVTVVLDHARPGRRADADRRFGEVAGSRSAQAAAPAGRPVGDEEGVLR